MERRNRLHRTGFTLVELLTVLSVISILAALLLPVLVNARRSAQRVTCQSNARQLAQALALYTTDYEESCVRWNSGPDGLVWDLALFPYVRSRELYHCPANPKRLAGLDGPILVRSYALPRNVSGLSLAAIPNPVDTVILYEKGGEPLGDRADATGEYFQQTYGNSQSDLWHPGGKVFAFADGHVRFFTLGRGPWVYDFPLPPSSNNYGPGYCGGQLNTTLDDDGGPGKNLPP